MPKARKPRSTAARSGPLTTTDTNASKKAAKASKNGTSANVSEKTSEPSNQEIADSLAPSDAQEPKILTLNERVLPENNGISDSTPLESYLLLVRLLGSFDPSITRLLSVPSSLTFSQLHEVLQTTFGWARCHTYSFTVHKLLEGGERLSAGRGDKILSLLGDGQSKDSLPDPEQIKRAEDYTLADIYDGDAYKGKVEVSYEYDPADSWEHGIFFLGRTDPTTRKALRIASDTRAVCLLGEGRPAAEGCGGTLGWENLKERFKKRDDPEGLKKWYKRTCANGDRMGLDPWDWNIGVVNWRLAGMFEEGCET